MSLSFVVGIRSAGDVNPFPQGQAALLQEETLPESNVRGDADGNGKVDIDDTILILEVSQGYRRSSPEEIRRGDMNGDFRLTEKDALQLLRFLALR
ncbi:MAG: hypothetical protein Greene041619_165 [Candidatus Peregrinibacteria bacterium Greene0416_19]|nr:MAG: hypothetical protein Greene041619_165 [Candidatus Peregrinibacteria bacterium Greene0416_19]